MVGRQRLSKYRIWIQLSLFPALVLLVALAAASKPISLVLFAATLAVGGALGRYGIRTTEFKPVPGNLYYAPNAYLGIALSLLFVLRVAYRVLEVSTSEPGVSHGATEFARSPLTLAVFGLLAGYYISYAVGLTVWRARVLKAKRLRLQAERNDPDA